MSVKITIVSTLNKIYRSYLIVFWLNIQRQRPQVEHTVTAARDSRK